MIPQSLAGWRTDQGLAFLLDKSRNSVQQLIKDGLLRGSQPFKASTKLKGGEVFELLTRPSSKLRGEDLPLDIIYEDEDVLVLNKPPGLVVHPGAGRASGTLVNALLARYTLPQREGEPFRPGIVHRLDKDTSGVMLVAKNEQALGELSRQFKDRLVHKTYLALVHGEIVSSEGRIVAPLARDWKERKKFQPNLRGKEAITEFKVLKCKSGYSLLEITPETGRTHQVRVHLAYIGHPIVGDPLYGPKNVWGVNGQLLHAFSLRFFHPVSRQPLTFQAPLPKSFHGVLAALSFIDKINLGKENFKKE